MSLLIDAPVEGSESGVAEPIGQKPASPAAAVQRAVAPRSILVLVAFGLVCLAAGLAWSRMFALDRGVIVCLVGSVIAVAASGAGNRVRRAVISWFSSLLLFVLYAACVAVPIDEFGLPTPAAIRTVLGWLPTMLRSSLDLGLPADSQGQPLLLALALTWIASTLGSELLLRSRSRAGALACPVSLFVLALLLGSPIPTRPLLLTVPLVVASMVFLAFSGKELSAGLQKRAQPSLRSDATRELSPAARIYRYVGGRGYGLLALVTVGAVVIAGRLPGVDGVQPSLHRPPPFESTRFVSPLLSLYSQLSSESPKRLFVVSNREGAEVDRIAVASLDYYNGDTWESRRVFRPIGEYSEPDNRAPAVIARGSATVTISDLDGPWVPHIGRVERLGLRGVQSDGPSENFVTAEGLAPGATFDLDYSVVPNRDSTVGSAVAGPLDPGWIQLPAGVPVDPSASAGELGAVSTCRVSDIVDLARKWTDGLSASGSIAADQMAKATTIEGKLRGSYGFSLAYGPGHSLADLCATVVSTTPKSAHSEQFAAAMAVMARGLGIPARVMVGYRLPEDSSTAATVVTESDAEAWVEANIGGAGWIPFDPTPSDTRDDSEKKTTITPQRPTPPPTTPPSTSVPPDSSTTTTTIPPVVPPSAERGVSAGTLVGAGGVLILVLSFAAFVGIALLKTRRRSRRRNTARAAESVVGAWLEALDLLRDRGFAVPSNLTARELAVLGPKQLEMPELDRPLRRLARLCGEALYSRRSLDAAAVDRSWKLVSEVEAQLNSGASFRTKLGSRFSIGSLRRSNW